MIKNSMIFKGMSNAEINETLQALGVYEKSYDKGEVILHAGDTTDFMGLVTKGSVTIESNDIWGNKTILSYVAGGQFFAETYALLDNAVLLVDAVANEKCTVAFFKLKSLYALAENKTPWSTKFIANLLAISTQKNLLLSQRSFHTSPKSVRGRVLSYLNSVSLQNHSLEFDIPFDRQQMADYLNLDRSALSKELSKMREEGIIRYRKSHFILKDIDMID